MKIKLNYIEKGSGKPLILLHGNGEDHNYFKNQMDYFSKIYRVIAIDTRGHGNTPRGDEPFTIRQFSEDLYEFLQQMEIKKAIFLGFSDGGNIALVFALTHPEYVEKLILNGANRNPKGIKRRFQWFVVLEYWITKNPEKKGLLRLMVMEPDIKLPELKLIRFPVLVIAGKKDMVKKKHTCEMAQNIPGAKLVLLKGDHFIAAKKSKEFNQAVITFLEGEETDEV